MTTEKFIQDWVNNNFERIADDFLQKYNDWGGFLSENEKKELFENGGVL